ncbi:protein MFI isoform X2 [Ictalurus punctatus]|uniref:Protein MFI isoform X2 n=1 Tax=Ictalurus punctatus TaxID=7998 RepID=A0A2D0PUI2_ICTPU|nr:protein MFI isoform X2 [Ictalurus punctatus]
MLKCSYLLCRAFTSSPTLRAEEEDKMPMSSQDRLYDQAARVIQRTWRKHANIIIFKYFKNLVSFRNQGAPCLLLKYVNPREADILDAASGVYMRFRLGGTSFPPNIYYKIFTHRPVVDLCASSPKDYTHAGQKRAVAQQVHNGLPLVQDDRSGWYRRVENNGWRLLSGKICHHGDPVTQDTSSKRTEFHHCKLIRRQDAERKKKIRKIEWMKKMYEERALHAHTEHRDTAALVENSAEGMMWAIEQLGHGTIVDWEVDELIEWTNALNFDEYINEWKLVGTSKSSMLQKDKQQVLSVYDPQEFSQLM